MKKKTTLLALSCVALSACALAFGGMKETNVSANTSGVTFEGARVRIASDYDKTGTGIRFDANITADVYESLVKDGAYTEGAELGMILLPQTVYEENTESLAWHTFLNDNYAAAADDAILEFTANKIVKKGDVYAVKGAWTGISVDTVNDDYVGIVYYKTSANAAYVYEVSETRSIAYGFGIRIWR